MLLAVGIFLATLVLVIWQPRGLGIGLSALGGAAVALAAKVVQFGDRPEGWHGVWNVTLAFVAVISVCSVLDERVDCGGHALGVAGRGRGDGSLVFALSVVFAGENAGRFVNV